MLAKLKSRKFWVATGGAVVILFGERLGLPAEHTRELVALLMTYLLSQGHVDAKAIR